MEKGKIKILTMDTVAKRVTLTLDEYKKLENQAMKIEELEVKLNNIWKEINNAHYFGDMKSRNFYNLIHEVAEIIQPNYEEIGKEFIE